MAEILWVPIPRDEHGFDSCGDGLETTVLICQIDSVLNLKEVKPSLPILVVEASDTFAAGTTQLQFCQAQNSTHRAPRYPIG